MTYIPQQGGGIPLTALVDTTALATDATLITDSVNITPYAQVTANIYARPGVVAGDGSSAKGSFYAEFSPDETNWDVSIPHVIRDPSLVIPVPLIFVHTYFRVRYLNDGGASAISALGLTESAGTATLQTEFRLTTYGHYTATKELTRTMDQSISGSDPVVLMRGAIMGRSFGGNIRQPNFNK